MKFFDRQAEIERLRHIREKANAAARFTVVTGRRRVGKTQLIKRALDDRPYLYFYVARKSEKDLCAGFQRQVEELYKIPAFGIAARDFSQFSGPALERYFRWKFAEEKRYTRMDAWWDRKGENEIDLVCEDELNGKLDFYEVKRDRGRIDLSKLRAKAAAFLTKNPELSDRQTTFAGLSLEDL